MRCKFSKLNICRLMAAFIAVMLAAALFVPYVSAAENSGSCGNDLKWEFANGTLTISGKGAMSNYLEPVPAPWAVFKKDIRVVNIGSGVTYVGDFAFFDHPNLKSVTLSDSVTSVGKFAFADCVKLSMVSFGSGLRSIEQNAFDDCESLQSVRLPMGLTSLGKQAFYSCATLRSITIPVTVTSMGIMCFAYCENLVSATVNASITQLPEWTFYGCEVLADVTFTATITSVDRQAFQNCDNLETVYYLGSPSTGIAVQEAVREDLDDASKLTLKFSSNPSGQSQVTVTRKDENNSTVVEKVTVKESQNSSISTTIITENKTGSSGTTVQIDAAVDTDRGWNELVDQIQKAATDASKGSQKVSGVQVHVNCDADNAIKGDALSELSGKNVNMTVNMNDGSAVKIDCKRLEDGSISGDYKMSYSLTENLAPAETLGDADSYVLKFTGNTELDFSPNIYVGEDRTHSCATLYQVESDGALTEVQSSIVDKEGNATFYLKSAYKNSEYVVAIDVLGVDRSSAIVPEDLRADYGITDEFEQIIIYTPTEEREFLGMNIAQFSFALFGVLALLVVAFGVVMGVFYRKKRLELFYRMKMEEEQAYKM